MKIKKILNKWHYLALKSIPTSNGQIKLTQSISRLFAGITSNHGNDYYCLGCLHSFRTKNKLKTHERLFNNHDHCEIIMPHEGQNILKFNQRDNLLKASHIFYFDIETLLLKAQSCKNNPEKPHTETKVIYEPSGYSLSLVTSYDSNKNKHSYYRGKDCMEVFPNSLRVQVMDIINTEEKPMIPLTEKQERLYDNKERCHMCKGKFSTNEYDKNYEDQQKVIDHDYYTGKYKGPAHRACHERCYEQGDISVIAYNSSNYDFHLIIKQLAREFKSDMKCL